ncbi:MAG: cell division protein FtsA [Candidatus Hydrogenedentes bacterium]|nr:cell division protein FtsA [Candidatus Hydrogenedentota bacterium]
MAKRGEVIGGVDFGSHRIRVAIARQRADGEIQIIGHGEAPSRGCVVQGIIQDLGEAQHALRRALQAAEKEAGKKVASLFCGVGGKNVETCIREGHVKLEKQEVELEHLEEALDQASRGLLAPGKRVVSSITSQEWYVDDLRVGDPIGLRGTVLKTRVHFAQLPAVIEDNLSTCIESQGRDLEDVVFLPLAAAIGCLTPEDMELGVAVLDMGRSTTGLAMYRDRRILATHSFEWGGFHLTRDVAAGLQISFEEANDLILEYGVPEALIRAGFEGEEGGEEKPAAVGSDGTAHIKLKSAVRGAPTIVERQVLDHIIYERSRELMTKVRQYLHARGLVKNLVRGVVITGGTASIKNQTLLAETIFQAPVRVGLPDSIDILPQPVNNPAYTPLVGVIRHGFEYRAATRSGRIESSRGFVGSLVHGLTNTFTKYFF